MARQFLTAIDLTKNEIQNAVAQNLAGAPASPVKGQFYFNSTDNVLYWWNGSAWIPAQDAGGSGFPGYGAAGATVAETTFGLTKADGVATTVARADHTHGSPVHDAVAHSTIPINALAVATGPIDMGGFPIAGVGAPVNPGDAANKEYVDGAIAGLSWKEPVRLVSAGNMALNGLFPLDGVTPVAGDRILAANQAPLSASGIYIASAGDWARAPDADSGPELEAAAVFVMEGTVYGDTAWVQAANPPITVGTTAMNWVQFSGPGTPYAGAGLTQTGNVINAVGDASIVVGANVITRAALTGDVTAAQSSNAMTIANNAVTNPKLADMPAGTFKGNNTAAVADPKDLTVAEMQAALGIAPGEIVTGGAGLVKTGSTLDVVGDASIVVAADNISRAALTGDVTAAGGANATTIAADAVTNVKLANMPGYTIKGNDASTAGDPKDLPGSQVRSIINAPSRYYSTIGDGTSVAFPIVHNLSTMGVVVSVYRATTPFDEVECTVEHTSFSTVTLRFTTAPTPDAYEVAIIG